MSYNDVLKKARDCIGPYCKACIECNGKVCRNQIPGPGAKGLGDVAIRNYDEWKKIRIVMDTFVEGGKADPSCTLFGHTFKYPFFAGPVGAVNLHYGDKYNDLQYNDLLVSGCAENGILAFTGDGTNPEVMKAASLAIQKVNGLAIPTIKPWNKEIIMEKMELVKDAIAIAMDIDAAGLPFLKNMTPPAGSKSVAEMKEIIDASPKPFIIKGIMSVKGALKAKEAGASGIVVSNHGGRVLDQCASTAEVLKDICDAVGNDMIVLVDGGIRSGADVFKALAMGANGVIIARPFVVSVYGDGIQEYIEKIGNELVDTMEMCGAKTLSDITYDMIQH